MLDEALLDHTQFSVVEAWKLRLRKSSIKDVAFRNAEAGKSLNMAEAMFNDARLQRVAFAMVGLSAAHFDNAVLEDVDFGQANLTGAMFDGARMIRVKIKDAVLTGVTLSPNQRANTDLPGSK